MDESWFEIDKKTWRVIVKKWTKAKTRWVEMLHSWKNVFWYLRLDGKIIYTIRDRKKQEDLKHSLYRLQEEDKTKYKILILDNASIHKSKKIVEYCKKRNIYLVYLPAYSPEYNLIEKVWKMAKRIFRLIQWDKSKDINTKIRIALTKLYWNYTWILENNLLKSIL